MLDAAAPPPLQRTSGEPEVGRVDEAALERLAEAAGKSHSAALVVLRGGELIGSWHAGGERRPIEAMSVTKSILNLAVGRLVTLDLVDSLDTPVHAFFPEWNDGPYSGITVRHLLNHTSGLESPMPTDPIYASDDFVRFALESDLVASPGQEMVYNNNATNLLAGLVGEAAGRRLDRFLDEQLVTVRMVEHFPGYDPERDGLADFQELARDLIR